MWVFCSEAGTAPEPRNLERVWFRVRRRAHKEGVRPLKLHCTRHTWATMALDAGRSVRWVADALGHADPALTLRVYAHAMHDEERDLSFAEFSDPKRPYTAPQLEERTEELANYAKSLARREGFEPPTPRFEAWCSIQLSYRRVRGLTITDRLGAARRSSSPGRGGVGGAPVVRGVRQPPLSSVSRRRPMPRRTPSRSKSRLRSSRRDSPSA